MHPAANKCLKVCLSALPDLFMQISTSADICMEALVDKLKLLDYEKEFCKKK